MSTRPISIDIGSPNQLQEIPDEDALSLPVQVDRGVQAASYAANMVTDFDAGTYQTVSASGDITDWITTNRPPAGETREAVIRIDPGVGARNLAFSASWRWMGATPASIAALKLGTLTLFCDGTAESDVVAKWEVEP